LNILSTTVSWVSITSTALVLAMAGVSFCCRFKASPKQHASLHTFFTIPPSTPPSISKRKKQYLTRDQRLQILILRDTNFTYDIISRQLHATYEQIEYICHFNHSTPKKRCGKSPIFNKIRTQELIIFIYIFRTHRLLTYAQLTLVLA
jgi:hypothetical protein